MADRWTQYERPEKDRWSQFEGEWPEGEDYTRPSQKSVVSAGERMQLQNLSPGAESSIQWLKARGYEAQQQEGGQLSVRRPGGEWGVVDPRGPDWGDFLDIGDELVSGAAGVAGLVSTKTPGGAGIGTAAAEAFRQSLGKIAGFEAPLAERAQAVALEGAMGYGAELGGRAIGKLGKKLFKGKPRSQTIAPSDAPTTKAPGQRRTTPKDLGDPEITRPTSAEGGTAGNVPSTVDQPIGSGGKPRKDLPAQTNRPSGAKGGGTEVVRDPTLSQEALQRQYEGAKAGTRESVDRVLQETGGGPLTIVFRKKSDGTIRVTNSAHIGGGPKFLTFDELVPQFAGMDDDLLRQMAIEEGVPAAATIGRGELLEGLWLKQPGLVMGKRAAQPKGPKDPNILTFWEEVVEGKTKSKDITKARKGMLSKQEGKDFGQWRSADKDTIIEIRRGNKVISFDEAGIPTFKGGPQVAIAGLKAPVSTFRQALAQKTETIGKFLKAPQQLQDQVVEGLVGKSPGLVGVLKRAAPMAIPGYGPLAMKARMASYFGTGFEEVSKLLKKPEAVKALMQNKPTQKTLSLVQRLVDNDASRNMRQMALFSLMHQPDFRSWQERYFKYKKRMGRYRSEPQRTTLEI